MSTGFDDGIQRNPFAGFDQNLRSGGNGSSFCFGIASVLLQKICSLRPDFCQGGNAFFGAGDGQSLQLIAKTEQNRNQCALPKFTQGHSRDNGDQQQGSFVQLKADNAFYAGPEQREPGYYSGCRQHEMRGEIRKRQKTQNSQ